MEDFMAKYDSAIRRSLLVMQLNIQLMNRFMDFLVHSKTLELRPEVTLRIGLCREIVRVIVLKHRQLEKLLESLREIKRLFEEQDQDNDVDVDDDNESNHDDGDDEPNDDDDGYENIDDEGFDGDEGFNEDGVFEYIFNDEGFRQSTLDGLSAKNNEIQWLNLHFKVNLDSLETMTAPAMMKKYRM